MVMHHCSAIVNVCQVAPPFQCPILIVNLTGGVFQRRAATESGSAHVSKISPTGLITVSNTTLLRRKMFEVRQRPHFPTECVAKQITFP